MAAAGALRQVQSELMGEEERGRKLEDDVKIVETEMDAVEE